jgi:ATP-dependent Lon protease
MSMAMDDHPTRDEDTLDEPLPIPPEDESERTLTGSITSASGDPKGDGGQGDLALATDVLPTTLHILPVVRRPMFPIQTLPVQVDEQPWMHTFLAMREQGQAMLGLVMVRGHAPGSDEATRTAQTSPLRRPEGSNDVTDGTETPLTVPTPEDFHEVGTVALIHQVTTQDGKLQFVAEGRQRFHIERWLTDKPPLVAQVRYIDTPVQPDEADSKAYAMAIVGVIKELIPLNPLYSEELKRFLDRFNPHQPDFLADFAANLTTASGPELQTILETGDLITRMQRVLALLQHELEVVQLQAQIRTDVEKSMTEQQRQFFLREQLKVIQTELGLSKDDRTADVERFEERLQDLKLTDEAQRRVDDELNKLGILEAGSPEYAVTRNYLDWITNLPWGRSGQDNLDLARARGILDEHHSGLEDVKERIKEFLAVGQLRGSVGGSIILLVGPPGVGKTSIGRSIAEAIDRPFYRFSVGGMRDEAEIKGHRRTYIGAMPGKFLQAMKSVNASNPVIMLDEIDKIGTSYQGDPGAALLEVLDPEQNAQFLDHYLDLPFDLSNVMFICTANQLDTIPQALLDRMETIRLSGYIAAEKVAIAKRHLLPRQRQRAGLSAKQFALSDAALRRVINGYAREAGVRGLEKQLGRLTRKAAVSVVNKDASSIKVTTKNLDQLLGQPLFGTERTLSGVGIVTGLAWTAMGGATLPIEASVVHNNQRGMRRTGNLGDVMLESAEIAYSYVAGHAAELGIAPGFFDSAQLHLHVPEGATPKDGPSAGVTMASALVSVARGARIKRPLAMTGELTLTGQVLPVGGIREKVIAARRVGIRELILPKANERDFTELPAHLREGLKVHFANRYNDVFDVIFGS